VDGAYTMFLVSLTTTQPALT